MSIVTFVVFAIAAAGIARFVMNRYNEKVEHDQEEQDELDYRLLHKPAPAPEPVVTDVSEALRLQMRDEASAHLTDTSRARLFDGHAIPVGKLDFSLESLKAMDTWLEGLARNRKAVDGDVLNDSLMWAGAYLGETVLRNSTRGHSWVTWHDYMSDKDESMKALTPYTFEYQFILKDSQNGAAFPFSKVSKFLDNGIEESLSYFASTFA